MPKRNDADPIEIPDVFIDSLPDELELTPLSEDELDSFSVPQNISDRFEVVRDQYLQRFGETFDIYRATQSGNPLELSEVADRMQKAIDSGEPLTDDDFGLEEFDVTADY